MRILHQRNVFGNERFLGCLVSEKPINLELVTERVNCEQTGNTTLLIGAGCLSVNMGGLGGS